VRNDSVKHVSLTRGTVVFAPSKTTVVHTSFGTITVAPRALVLVMAMKEGIAVYDLDDGHRAAVVVETGDRKEALSPGRHIFIGRDTGRGFEQVNAAQLFAYRNIRQQAGWKDCDGHALNAFTAEFDLLRALNVVTPLKGLITVQNPQAKKIVRRMLKTTAIISQIVSSGEAYRQVLRPGLVAMK
jgi:hypothetical protein